MKPAVTWDTHLHSAFSGDCTVPMETMIQRALDLGLEGLCFTEHLDPDYPPIPEDLDFSLDLISYRQEFLRLQEKYQGRISLLFGVELGLQPHLGEEFSNLLSQTPFDFVIGSSHVVHGFDPYYPDFFQGRKEHLCYMEYFESILENLSLFSEMDVYGHLDYIVRFGPNQNREYSYGRYQDILDEILRTLIEKGCGLELNTGGFSRGLGEPNPCRAILRRYRQLGGEIVTIGSDAHTPDQLAAAFDQAGEVLLECGFTHYTLFKDRKPHFLPLLRGNL